MNQPQATPSVAEFLKVLRQRRMEASIALTKAQEQYGGPYVPPPAVTTADPTVNNDAVFAQADQFDRELYDHQQGRLRMMAELLDRLTLAERLLEENGPHAVALALRALQGGAASQATMH